MTQQQDEDYVDTFLAGAHDASQEELGRAAMTAISEQEWTAYDRIHDGRERQKQGSQMRLRLEKAATRAMARTGWNYAIVTVNEIGNTFYFSTVGGANYFQHTRLIARLEVAKREAPAKQQLVVNVEEVMNAYRGTVAKPGENYMVKVGQCLAELGIEDDVLNLVHEKYLSRLMSEPSFDVANALKNKITSALNHIVANGFGNATNATNVTNATNATNVTNATNAMNTMEIDDE
tara:strand:- start:3083 stop:3784 length:702 start_codon:yes stop_codon:yes gene_type:complete